ncbi:MAG: lipoyl(octanoyl) transferase LipB [Chloroflexota bacterium]
MISARWLGKVDYLTAWDEQKRCVLAFKENDAEPDQILFVEHPPTYTLGSRGNLEHLLLNDDQLADEGISVHKVNRGGDITYHGPGQLVAYPIFHLRRCSQRQGYAKFSIHQYVRDLEEVIIQAIQPFGLAGWRYPGYTGVWVGSESDPRKIAAIGIHVSRGISSHGFALNVDPNMTHFKHIIPCGIREHGVTSIRQEINRPISLEKLLPPVQLAFEQVFKDQIQMLTAEAV